ncbi:shikimate dehydrogenase family protein [Oceanobacillus jeddahense]|uniref:Shikimate dehydrogenase n=1 Tax=Oceanobacillus jeddahense TaxID=1462527 RepID=A0ABY5JPU6_9BACI|nr:shikimate dehydrogenase [Oceanobacillus jeddahense]UUI02323.1 shikimate dehydrogenase [Oceanobacillus jeddahense]
MQLPDSATQPTMYFIGVTTTKSSIMKLFPLWAKELGLDNAVLKGIDIDIHDEDQVYQDVVNFIKNDPESKGALVTTHKIDLYNAAKENFDYLDPYAKMLDEISSISKSENGNELRGHAKDPITSGLALEEFVPENYWQKGGEVFLMGAGGSTLAISSYLTDKKHGDNVPKKIIISNRSEQRLVSAKNLLSKLDTTTEFEFHHAPNPEDNDKILETLSPHSLVVNATGLGKDRPGSPLTDKGVFPNDSLAWELNYRGELDFMHQALAQKEERNLHVEDGWIYFIHGWTQVIGEVFNVDIKSHINQLEQIAADFQKNK